MGNVRHHTFDVFDTVLTRTVGDPEVLFRKLGHRMRDEGLTTCDPLVVAAARVRAESWLAGRLGRGARLAEIHRELVRSLGLGADVWLRSHEIELDVEREASRPVPGAAERLTEARQRAGGRLGFVSDTPLPGRFVVELLSAANLWQDGDLCFCSADAGADKYSGRLFPMVAAAFGDDPDAIVHHGDNSWNDVARARMRGLRAVSVPDARLTRYESTLEDHSAVTDGLTSVLAGASRLARLEATSRGARPEVAAVASGVFAPLMVGFGLWLAVQARNRGLRRMYFVSRDGELPMRVTELLLERFAPDVAVRYLYGSRAAWHLASTALVPDRALDEWVTDPLDTEVTPRQLLARVRVTVEDARSVDPSPLYADDRVDRALSVAERDRILVGLQSGPLAAVVRDHGRRQRDLVLAYLRQEGLGEEIPTAVVDIGWMGRTTRSLDDIMASAGLPQVDSYLYLGLNAGADRWSGPRVSARHDAWLYDDDAGHGVPIPLPAGHVLLMETMCSGTEGGTMGYRQDGDRVAPVLLSPKNTPALEWGLGEVQDVVLQTTRLLARAGSLCPEVDLRAACMDVATAFWERPSRAEVRAWADFPYDDTGQVDGQRPLASAVRSRFVLDQVLAGHRRVRPVASWLAGTTALSPLPWKVVLGARTMVSRHGARVRRIPRRLAVEWHRRRR